MQTKRFAGLLAVTMVVGTALPVFAADEPFQVAQTRKTSAQTQTMDSDTKEIRAILAGVSSVILPGFGQWVFNQERPKAVMHFLGAVVLWAIPSFVPIPSPLDRLYLAIPTLFHLYSGYDAYQGAGGEVKLVQQPSLGAWSFDAQVERFGQAQAFDSPDLGHLTLASTQLSY